MTKQEFQGWARGWISSEYDYGAYTPEEIAAFDPKAGEMFKKMGESVIALENYLKTRLSDSH